MKARSIIRFHLHIICNLTEFQVSVLGFDHCPLEFDVSGVPNSSLFTSVDREMVPKQCQVNTRTKHSMKQHTHYCQEP